MQWRIVDRVAVIFARRRRLFAGRVCWWRIVVRVAVIFAAALAATAVNSGELDGAWMDAFCAMWARIAGFALTLLGVPASSGGVTVGADAFTAIIVPACTALDVIILFAAAVLAYPASIGARLRGLLLGIAALFTLNIVRIVSLILIGIHYFDLLEDAHLQVWQATMALSAIGLWLLWHSWASRAPMGKPRRRLAIARYRR